MMKAASLAAIALIFEACAVQAASGAPAASRSSATAQSVNLDASKISLGVITQDIDLRSPKISLGIVSQGGAFYSAKISMGLVTGNETLQASKVSMGIVVQVQNNNGIVVRTPLTHW